MRHLHKSVPMRDIDGARGMNLTYARLHCYRFWFDYYSWAFSIPTDNANHQSARILGCNGNARSKGEHARYAYHGSDDLR